MWNPFSKKPEQEILRLKDSINRRDGTQKLTLESMWDFYSSFGLPVDPHNLNPDGTGQYMIGAAPIEFYPWKSTVLRTVVDFDIVRQSCRKLYETNGNVKGLMQNLANYVVGEGWTLKLSHDDAKTVVKDTEKFLDEFIEANNLQLYYWEHWIDTHVDGESFIRLFPNQNGITEVRTIHCDMIRPPMGSNWEGEWSFGVKKPIWDSGGNPEAYNIYYYTYLMDNWNKAREEIVDPSLMFQLKLNSRRNTKRGISSFYAVLDEADLSKRLRYIQGLSEEERKRIAYFRQFGDASREGVKALEQREKQKAQKRNIESYEIGLKSGRVVVVDTPQSVEIKDPPNAQHEGGIAIIKNNLETIAASFSAPSFLITGQADASSYSSAVVVESPFHKSISRQQKVFTDYWVKIFKAAIEIGVAQKQLPVKALDLKIGLTAPSPLGRNRKEENESWLILVEKKIMSQHKWASLNDLDYDEQQKIIRTEPEIAPDNPLKDNNSAGNPSTMSAYMQRDNGKIE